MFSTESSELLWFLAGIALLVLEQWYPRVIALFFGAGAWITAVCIALGVTDSFIWQVVLFLCSSVATLVLCRKATIKYYSQPSPASTTEEPPRNSGGRKSDALQ